MLDSYGRNIEYMRLSITDRCNLRCRYCMPNGIQCTSHGEILSYEEILRLCRIAVSLGIDRFKITGGEPAVVVDKALMLPDGSKAWEAFEQNLRQNFIAGDGLSLLRQIENQFATDIGIPNANTEKRERAVVDEINANNVETYSKCALWLESLQDGCERVKRMFGESLGGELAVDWRFQPMVEKPEDSGEVVEDEK